jgi:hypothetical protein
VPVVAIIVETFFTFSQGNKIIVTSSRPDIKKVSSSFTGFEALAKQGFAVSLIVIFVRHGQIMFKSENSTNKYTISPE